MKTMFKTAHFKSGYGTVQRDALTADISIQSKAMYALLMSYQGEKKSCFPSIQTISENLHVSKRSVIRYIKELCNCNLVVKSKHGLKNGFRQNNQYQVLQICD